VYPRVVGGQNGGPTFAAPQMYYYTGPVSGITRDATGSITAASLSLPEALYRHSISQSGSTMTDFGKNDATGLSWGRWQGGTVTMSMQYPGTDSTGRTGIGADDASGNFVIGATRTDAVTLGTGSLHWISGQMGSPDYLTEVLTGTATYSLVGGTRPTDTQGNTGTLDSATLSANFASQTVDAGVRLTIGGNLWALQSSGMPLDGQFFGSYNSCTGAGCAAGVSVTKNGASVPSSGSPSNEWALGFMNGMLSGTGLNAASLQYALQDYIPTTGTDASGNTFVTFSSNLITGVAGFSGPTQTLPSFRGVALNDIWNGDELMFSDDALRDLRAAGIYRGSIEGGFNAMDAVVADASGGMTAFRGYASGYTRTDGTVYEDRDDVPATIRIGTAVNRDLGATTIGTTTLNWGRWEGGAIDIYSRDGSTRLGTIDNSNRSVHWLSTSALNRDDFVLPLTGTATYVVAGATSPTDFRGGTGKLESASLAADFANARVEASVNVSFSLPNHTATWTMRASNVPLHPDGEFYSSTAINGHNGVVHSVTCAGSGCGTAAVGHLDGNLLGAQGAVMSYGMATGTPANATSSSFIPTNTATGMVIMKR